MINKFHDGLTDIERELKEHAEEKKTDGYKGPVFNAVDCFIRNETEKIEKNH